MSASDQSSHDQRGDRPSLLDRLRNLFGLGSASIRDDIEDALDDESIQSDLSAQERVLLKNVLGLHELRVQDVMVPRADVIAVGLDATLGEILTVFRTAGHSRLPVHGENLDDPRGMVHIRDFVDYLATAMDGFLRAPQAELGQDIEERSPRRQALMKLRGLGEVDLTLPLSKAGIVRPVLFVPPSMPALDLLVKMQATRTHMALVIDEYGGTDGLASIEDIVETIVGDIEDEHDEDERPVIQKDQDDSWIVDARASLDDLTHSVGFDFEALSSGGHIDTLGGLVSTLAGRVPARGERIDAGLVSFEVIDADRRRLKRVRVRILDLSSAARTNPGESRAGDQGV
jgi:CBS domain containing-hemolysin-like protein